jgi:hypothetical protein
MNFEQGIEAAEIESTIPGLVFTTTHGINWRFGDIRTGDYNVYPYGDGQYEVNGNFFAWLGVTGDAGRITFTGGPASYVSVLVSTYSGVTLDAYDKDGNFLATSGWATDNLDTRTTTRLTVEATDIAYVEIHDTGNYWLMDDLCTDAPPVCKPVSGRTEGAHANRIDLVFVPDEDYGLPEDIDTWLPTFLGHIDHKIDNRLAGHAPVTGNLNKFNFYYSEKQGTVDSTNCAEDSSIPDRFIQDCSFADAIVVLHTSTFGDCSYTDNSPNVYSAEGNTDRSFIHETGHGVFGAADEYDGSPGCRTRYFQPDPNPNIWATETACETDATAQGWDPDDCDMFTTCQGDWWKIGTTRYIMKDGDDFANGWGEPGAWRVGWVLDQYSGRFAGSASKSVWLDLNMSDDPLALLGKGFVISSPPDYLPGDYAFKARVVSTTDETLGEFGFGDPRRKYAESDYIGPTLLDSADFTVTLPYFYNGSRVEIVDTASGGILLTVDISEFLDPSGPSNQTPTADAGPDQVVECTGAETLVALDGTGSSDPDGDLLSCQWTSDTCTFDEPASCITDASCPHGENVATLNVNDGAEDSDPDTALITVEDTTPPQIAAPGPAMAECASPDGTPVDLGMATSSDICCGDAAISNDAPMLFPLGETVVTWTAEDCNGNYDTATQLVTVVDTTPPEIAVSLTPDRLWPPNHAMVDIEATVVATDICSTPTVALEMVSSDEPDNAEGIGDGDTDDDIQGDDLGTADFSFQLRAERAGSGHGRTYAATYVATDPSGNQTPATTIVFVPHDSGGNSPMPEVAGQGEGGFTSLSGNLGGTSTRQPRTKRRDDVDREVKPQPRPEDSKADKSSKTTGSRR